MAFSDIIGNIQGFFQLGIGGNKVKNASGGIAIRNAGDTSDAQLTTSQLNNSGNQIVLNSAAAQSGASWLYNLVRPNTGMSANMTLTLPATTPTIGQALVATDTAGTLAFQTIATGTSADRPQDKTYTLSYNTSSPLTLFTLAANAIVKNVTIYVDTVFTGGTPTVAIGVAGNTGQFMTTAQNDLTDAAGAKSYITNPTVAANASAQNLIATYVANSATAGSARILIEISTPSNP